MKRHINYMILCGIACLLFGYAIYHLGKLHFLPVWDGGLKDKAIVTLPLLLCTSFFVISFQQFASIALYALFRMFDLAEKFNFTITSNGVRIALFPLKAFALAASTAIGYSLWDLSGGLILTIIITYVYFDKMPLINKYINNKIAGGLHND